jgi:hypothetical protein
VTSTATDRSAFNFARALQFSLRLAGSVEMLAMLAVVMPPSWMAEAHQALKLGEFSKEPLVGYLARTTSLMWAVHGATICFLASDVARYLPVLRLNGWLTLVMGICLLSIDFLAEMPAWWTAIEGPIVIVMGLWFLIAVRRVAAAQQ